MVTYYDINNRAIAIILYFAFSKLFESVIADCLYSQSKSDEFKVFVVNCFKKESTDYYRKRGSHVFPCVIDIVKNTFNNVNYSKLLGLTKLTHDKIDCQIVKLLAF